MIKTKFQIENMIINKNLIQLIKYKKKKLFIKNLDIVLKINLKN